MFEVGVLFVLLARTLSNGVLICLRVTWGGDMSPKIERRSGADRRLRDLDPVRGLERRKRAEARKPDIAEVVLSEDEWKRHFGRDRAFPRSTEKTTSTEVSGVIRAI